MEVQLPGSMAGMTYRQETMKPEGQYENLRAQDLKYAIQWNRDAGKDLPPVPDGADKESLVSYCKMYKIDLNKCQTYVDNQNMIKISRPPSTYKIDEVVSPLVKGPEKMNPFELKKFLKENGVDFGDATKKDELLAVWEKHLSDNASSGG